jgi:DNA invertase Pin-like site-specific DNA recombinase
MTWNIETDANETLDVIGERHQWRLEQLEATTQLLVAKVRDAHANGEPVAKIAKRARVSRMTVYRWLENTTRNMQLQ